MALTPLNETVPERYVILPSPGDPFLLKYWWDHFKPVLEQEQIDYLVVVQNSPTPPEVKRYIFKTLQYNNMVHHMDYDEYIDHGTAIVRGLSLVPELADVMLIEDDCIVLNPEAIGNNFTELHEFRKTESLASPIIGSPRNSCSNEIVEVADYYFGTMYAPCGEEGVNFWPNVLFCAASLLRSTTLQFNGRVWQKGEVISPLNHTCRDLCSSDTFVEASLELRGKGLTIKTLNQGHLNQIDHELFPRQQGIFAWPNPDWVHIGSLSMGMSTMLIDEDNKSLASNTERYLSDLANPVESADIYRQATYWLSRVFDHYVVSLDREFEKDNPFDHFTWRYGYAIHKLNEKFGVTDMWGRQRDVMYSSIGLNVG